MPLIRGIFITRMIKYNVKGEKIFEYSFLKIKYFKTNKEGDYILVRQMRENGSGRGSRNATINYLGRICIL